MPFRSQAQRRKFYALKSEGKMTQRKIDEWDDETPKDIPERVKSSGIDARYRQLLERREPGGSDKCASCGLLRGEHDVRHPFVPEDWARGFLEAGRANQEALMGKAAGLEEDVREEYRNRLVPTLASGAALGGTMGRVVADELGSGKLRKLKGMAAGMPAGAAAMYGLSRLEAGNKVKRLQEKTAARRHVQHNDFQGFPITIELEKGAIRRGKSPDGTPWERKMSADYGYIRRTVGTDGEHVDVYLGPDEDVDQVYIVDQMKPPEFTEFDEQKCCLGFGSEDAARKAYLAHYPDERFCGAITSMPLEAFREKVMARESHGQKLAAFGCHMMSLMRGHRA